MPHLSDLCHTISKCHQSIFVQVVPDDAHPGPFQTIMSLTVDHLASYKYAQTFGASSFVLYPPLFLFIVQLLLSLH